MLTMIDEIETLSGATMKQFFHKLRNISSHTAMSVPSRSEFNSVFRRMKKDVAVRRDPTDKRCKLSVVTDFR